MRKPFIFFITGISCSGKTHLFEKLRENTSFKDVSFHDVDENGVPEVGRTHWRPFRVEELLNNALKEYRRGKSSILCGISHPSEVLDFKYIEPSLNIHFLLLNMSIEIFQIRMSARLKDSTEDIDFAELEIETKGLKRRLLNNVSALKNGHILDTGTLSKDEMVMQAEKIIED